MLDYQQFVDTALKLEQHHAIFYTLWNLGRPVFSTQTKTAAVSFDAVGETINFEINEEFWNSLTDTQRLFILSHECLHVILYHGIRVSGLKTKSEIKIANYAADIVVNHTLVDRFGFKREEVDPDNKLCWVDTVFKKDIPEPGHNFEYYYSLIEKDMEASGGNTELDKSLADDHDGFSSFATPEFEDVLGEAIDESQAGSLEDLIKEHTEDIQEQLQERGLTPGNIWYVAQIGKVKEKKKWETVIKKWAKKFNKQAEAEQWARLNRRLQFMANDFMLPSDFEVDDFEKDKIQVWFFQDTSGSCCGFRDRFFKAASSLPKDKFDVKMHCFDTRVFETSLDSGKLYGFGGTSFSCLEAYIQNYMKANNVPYPKAVFVITDGYGNHVNPAHPEVWHWFLNPHYTRCIPDACHTYNLRDFE